MLKFKHLIISLFLLFFAGCSSTSVNLNPFNEEGSAILVDFSNTSNFVSEEFVTTAQSKVFAVAQGLVPNASMFRILGNNEDVDNVREDLWEVGGTYVFPPDTGIQMQIVSTSNEDNFYTGGTGVQVIHIEYLDSNFTAKNELVFMNGTTPVLTTATNIARVNGMHTNATGSNFLAVGNIDLTNVLGAPIYSRITNNGNVALSAVYTVPANYTAYLTLWKAGVGSAQGERFSQFRLRATAHTQNVIREPVPDLSPGIFHFKDIVNLQDGTAVIPFSGPIALPPRTDIKISVKSDNPNANALTAGHFEGWIEYTG